MFLNKKRPTIINQDKHIIPGRFTVGSAFFSKRPLASLQIGEKRFSQTTKLLPIDFGYNPSSFGFLIISIQIF
jgi:hypothetical protein